MGDIVVARRSAVCFLFGSVSRNIGDSCYELEY